jgi:hypothetical protein
MISFPCPSCQCPLEVADELAGREFRCPDCTDTVVVPAAANAAITRPPAVNWPISPTPPSTAITNQPSAERNLPTWPQGRAPSVALDHTFAAFGWTSVCTGLRLFQISVVVKVGILATYLLALGSLLQAAGKTDPRDRFGSLEPLDLHATVMVAVVAGEILQLAGAIFLTQVPERGGCKPYAITVLICQVAITASVLLVYAGRPLAALAAAQLLGAAAGLIMFVVLLILLHKIGSHFGSLELRRQVVRFAICYVIGVIGAGAFVAIGILGIASLKHAPSFGVFLVVLIGLGALMVLLVMQANLFSLARAVIRGRLGNPAKES